MIKNFFKGLSKDSDFDSYKKEESNNKIIFEIQDENIKVDLLFNHSNSESSQKIGEFLYYLNNGYYITHILDILVGLSNDKPEYKAFVHQIINAWSQKIPLEPNNEDAPIIPPTHFQQNTFFKKT